MQEMISPIKTVSLLNQGYSKFIHPIEVSLEQLEEDKFKVTHLALPNQSTIANSKTIISHESEKKINDSFRTSDFIFRYEDIKLLRLQEISLEDLSACGFNSTDFNEDEKSINELLKETIKIETTYKDNPWVILYSLVIVGKIKKD